MSCYYACHVYMLPCSCPSYFHASPRHEGTVTMALEAPVSWLLHGRVIFSWRPFQLFISYHVGHLFMWGVWVHPRIFMSWLQGDCGVCSTPLHMELIPPLIFQIEVTPLVHVEAAPQLMVHIVCYRLLYVWTRGKFPVILCYLLIPNLDRFLNLMLRCSCLE